MAKPIGSPKTGGRAKGTPNKVTKDLKAAILGAFHAQGGQAYLEKVAAEDPRTFCTLLGKVLPTEVKAELTGKDGEPLNITVKFINAD